MIEWMGILLLVSIWPLWVSYKLLPRVSKAKPVSAYKPGESYVYDPTQDPDKVMKGEIESYFD